MDGYLANIKTLVQKTEKTLLKKIENNTISEGVQKKQE